MIILKKKFNLNLYRKKRYKPLYKKFINLKETIQYKKKIINFNKLKWKKFKKINFINIKKNFNILDHNNYCVSIFYKNIFKKRFFSQLQLNRKFNLFYNYLPQKYLNSIKKKNNFLEILEKRIDLILYRSHFVLSIRAARQLIIHNKININKKITNCSSFLLKTGDLLELTSTNLHQLILKNIKKNNFWPIPPKYLEINYKTLQILLTDNIKFTNLLNQISFWLKIFFSSSEVRANVC